MKAITFECETVTPMFLGGADGRTPELRPPSIKGAMRFWWRAMNGHLSLKELKEREAEIFGASDEKIGRSRFNIHLKKQLSSKDTAKSLWDEIPYKKYKSPTEYAGVSYLLYSTHMLNERPYIKSNTSFSIELSSNNEKCLQDAVHSFAIFTFFGALGTRNRRGAGSFAVKNVIYKGDAYYKNLFDMSKIQSDKQLKGHIESKLRTLLGNKSNISYSTLKNSKIYILDPKNDWKNALEMIGSPFLYFRNKNKRRISDTPNFGFPILHKQPKMVIGAGPKNIKTNKKGNVVNFIERRASPLIFKVIKTNQDCYFPLIIWLNGELIPSDCMIMAKKGGECKNTQ